MSKGTKAVIAIAVLVAVAVVSGLTTMAVTNYGSKDDPLVTLSYLNETVTPAITDAFNKPLDEKAAELTGQFNDLIAQAGLGEEENTSSTQPSGFVVVTLKNGQTVTCGVGTEIMLRIGTAESFGPDTPRLSDETGGQSVNDAGTQLTVNHMYMVTIKGNGVKATRDNTKILIRGEYTVA